MLRHERGIPVPSKVDSVYVPIKRKEKIFKPLQIPDSLQASLPFRVKAKQAKQSKEKITIKSNTKEYFKGIKGVGGGMNSHEPRAVIMTKAEENVHRLLGRLDIVKKEKDKIRGANEKKSQKASKKRKLKENERLEEYRKKVKKQRMKEIGMKKKKAEFKMNKQN